MSKHSGTTALCICRHIYPVHTGVKLFILTIIRILSSQTSTVFTQNLKSKFNIHARYRRLYTCCILLKSAIVDIPKSVSETCFFNNVGKLS